MLRGFTRESGNENEKSRYAVSCVTASYDQVGEKKISVVESMQTVVVIDFPIVARVQPWA